MKSNFRIFFLLIKLKKELFYTISSQFIWKYMHNVKKAFLVGKAFITFYILMKSKSPELDKLF